ncbi:NTP transferase domain-containing protein [Klebsiella indica]|uniref:Molybdenum cofactor cytidylyltransferase n=1 Tax=Klebsiella indica TaxID=2582917 RepID=A0A5R9LIV5_9ENTR|nr:NTP transferase domain-containing protein [Klebsiella indica]TLV18302.1 molybdenum cofactor cytidylyltransferase [Klebsiella indica]
MPPIDCIITAAGLSSRMGKWKMMLPWQDGTILDASIKNALQFCSQVILVTGYRGDELYHRYAGASHILITHNPDYADGLYSSVKVAANAVKSEYCFITHGDMPCLTFEIFNKIWSLRNDSALIPYYQGTPGHPILLTRRCLLQALSGPQKNMHQALLAGAHNKVEIDHIEIISDVDTPEDFIRLHQR